MSFVPANDLEERLLEAQGGEATKALFDAFIASQAVILLDKPPASGAWDNSINPLVLNSPDGFPVLALFSSPERATAVAQRAPQHKLALQVDVRWILRGVQPHVGIAMNPGSGVGFQLPPESVSGLKHDYGIE